MNRIRDGHSLIIAIRPRMIIGPRQLAIVLIITNVSRWIRLHLFRMKEVSATYATKRAQRHAEILVIARCHDSAAALPESRDAAAIIDTQSLSKIDSKEPQLVEV